MELIESRKQKRSSTASPFEDHDRQISMTANTKPGKSTHPYDTEMGQVVNTRAEDNNDQSRPLQQATAPRDQAMNTPTQPQKVKKVSSSPSLVSHTPSNRERNKEDYTPESQTEDSHSSRPRIKFRNMLGANKHHKGSSNTNPSGTTSTSPPQPPTEVETMPETQQRSWWLFKKQRTESKDSRHGLSSSEKTATVSGEEDADVLTALYKPVRIWKTARQRRQSKYVKGRVTKNTQSSKAGSVSRRMVKGAAVRQEAPFLKTKQKANDISRQTHRTVMTSSKRPRPMLQRQYRRSLSTSRTQLSTTGTSSTPGNGTANKEMARDDWRETPSPIIQNRALRVFLGARGSPRIKSATQPELRGIEATTSASTLHLERQSRDSRAFEPKSRVWIPFWGSPKPQTEELLGDDGDKSPKPGDTSEAGRLKVPAEGETTKQKDKATRKGWRSG